MRGRSGNAAGDPFGRVPVQGDIVGTIDGVPTTGTLTYQGITEAGGHIDADLIIRDGRVHAVLSADAFVLGGGTYTGTIRT